MEYPITLIYMFDEETLGQLHDGWPVGVQAALCLDEEGGSLVVLLNEEEARDAAEHLSGVLGRDDSDFVFVPKFGGYPTRRVSFGEEQQLCAMIAEIEDLPDRALETLVRSDESDEVVPECSGPPRVDRREVDMACSETAMRAVPNRTSPIERRGDASLQEQRRLPPGFISPDPCEVRWPSHLPAHISKFGDHARLTIDGAGLFERFLKPCRAAHAGVSPERTQICIVPADDSGWQPKPGASILFPQEALRSVTQGAPFSGPVRASVSVEDGSVIVSIDEVAPAPEPKARRQRGALRSLAGPAFAAVVVGAMLQIGMSEEALHHMRQVAESVSYQGVANGS